MLRRDPVSCKPHPKIQPEKLHPQIGYRRFTSACGGQVPWERRRPRRHTAQPRPRGTGALGAPTSPSAHGSPPPAEDRLHCVLPNARTHLLISASGDSAPRRDRSVPVLVSPGNVGWTETRVTWLRVGAGYCNPTSKLHPRIGYRRFTPARGGQVPWERRRPRRHTAQPRPRGQVHHTWISRVRVLVSSGSVAWTETCITWLQALPLVSYKEEDGSKT